MIANHRDSALLAWPVIPHPHYKSKSFSTPKPIPMFAHPYNSTCVCSGRIYMSICMSMSNVLLCSLCLYMQFLFIYTYISILNCATADIVHLKLSMYERRLLDSGKIVCTLSQLLCSKILPKHQDWYTGCGIRVWNQLNISKMCFFKMQILSWNI